MATAVTVRADFSTDELRRLAAASKHANQSRRLLSLAAELDGMSRADAARIGGMDRQTLRDWVHRFNERGPEGLKDRWSKGHPPRLSAEQLAQLAEVVETGPERAVHGVVRWRRVDLQQIVAERFGVAYHERTIGKILKQLGFSHVSASAPSGQGRGRTLPPLLRAELDRLRAVHPVPQRLAVHATDPRGIGPAHPIQHRRKRQQTPTLVGVLGGRRKPPQLVGRKVRPHRHRCRHGTNPPAPWNQLNIEREIASESERKAVGMRRVCSALEADRGSLKLVCRHPSLRRPPMKVFGLQAPIYRGAWLSSRLTAQTSQLAAVRRDALERWRRARSRGLSAEEARAVG